MAQFEIIKQGNNFKKIWNEIYLLLFFNIGLVIGNITFFSSYYLIIELSVFSLLGYQLLNPRNRHVYKLFINEEYYFIEVYYYQFILFKFKRKIPFSSLQVNYKYKVFGRGKIPKTLEIRKNRLLIAEIRHKYNLGWTVEQIDNIYEKLYKIEQNANYKV